MNSDRPEALTNFIEEVGLAYEGEGFPRTMGRIMGLMIVCEGPFSLDDLADGLDISRGNASMSTRRLEDMNVVRRTSKPGDRKVYYQLTADPYGRLIEQQQERVRRLEDLVERTLEELPDGYDKARKRLGYLEEFYGMAVEHIETLIERWREREVHVESE